MDNTTYFIIEFRSHGDPIKFWYLDCDLKLTNDAKKMLKVKEVHTCIKIILYLSALGITFIDKEHVQKFHIHKVSGNKKTDA